VATIALTSLQNASKICCSKLNRFWMLAARFWILDLRTWIVDDEDLYHSLHDRLEVLGKKLNRFIESVEKEHLSQK